MVVSEYEMVLAPGLAICIHEPAISVFLSSLNPVSLFDLSCQYKLICDWEMSMALKFAGVIGGISVLIPDWVGENLLSVSPSPNCE